MPTVVQASALESTVRRLAGFVGVRAPVTSFYLDVDGRRHLRWADVERRATVLLRSRRAELDGAAEDASVKADLRRIEDFVHAGFDRSGVRGLAFFACDAQNLFQVVALPAPVHDRLVVNHVPALGQLEKILQEHGPVAVLLADRQRARILVFELGELTDRSELLDELPRDYDVTGDHDRGTPAGHVDALVGAHLRHTADAVWRMYQERPFAHLALGVPEALCGTLQSMLHPYVQERLFGRITLTMGASLAEIRAAAMEVDAEADRRREEALVARLRDAAAAGRRGVAGLAPTLAALNEHRVERLIVSDGYAEEGWRCPATGALAAFGPSSPMTGEPMDKVADVVEDAIEAALNQGCRVDIVTGNADLDCLGRIGALLRF